MAKGYKIGRYLLDTLTSGMYDNPLCVYREYVQNSVDAVDTLSRETGKPRTDYEVRINIDTPNKKIEIIDNGCGIPAEAAERILLSIGDSDKFGNRERGFRGIGRLGGVAYCDSLCFRTKASGENIETIISWDCSQIRQLLYPSNRAARNLSLGDLIDASVTVKTNGTGKRASDSYFCIQMDNVRCAKNILLDVKAVRKYLTQVAPVPFDFMMFAYGEDLHNWLNKQVPNYNVYRVFVNEEEILKPYSQTVLVRKGETDSIVNIVKYDITDNDGKAIAYGWRGIRKNNLAQLNAFEGVDGIRVRIGNILLGDKNVLDDAFREARFNRYNIGEVHVIDPALIPNARRDNFEDGELKSVFFNSIERELGIPLRKTIRDASKNVSNLKPLKLADEIILTVQNQEKKGFVSKNHKGNMIRDLRSAKTELEVMQKKNKLDSKIKQDTLVRIDKINEFVNRLEGTKPDITSLLAAKYSQKDRTTIQAVLEAVYENYPKTNDRVRLIEKVVAYLNRGN